VKVFFCFFFRRTLAVHYSAESPAMQTSMKHLRRHRTSTAHCCSVAPTAHCQLLLSALQTAEKLSLLMSSKVRNTSMSFGGRSLPPVLRSSSPIFSASLSCFAVARSSSCAHRGSFFLTLCFVEPSDASGLTQQHAYDANQRLYLERLAGHAYMTCCTFSNCMLCSVNHTKQGSSS
jgi:hypothetical protein